MKILSLYRFIFLLFANSLSFTTFSQVNFTTSVSQNPTGIDDVLEITYTANASGKFNAPSFKNFDVLSGPSQGQSTQVSIRNGRASQTVKYSFSYQVKPKQLGKFQTPIASFEANGTKYTSNPIEVTVVKEPQRRQRSRDPFADMFGGRDPFEDLLRNQRPREPQIDNSEENFYGKIIISNSNPYVGENVFVTYKLYTRYGNIQVQEEDFPTQQGVWSEDIPSPKQIEPVIENIDGKQYYVFTIKKEILYPQKSGDLDLIPFKIKAIVNQGFFNPGTIVSTTSTAPRLIVKALPSDAPISFSNQVGNDYSISLSASKDTIKVDESIDFKLKITGTGNLKQLGSITLNLPKEFESYDPETKQNISITNGTNTGWKEFNHLAIPRHPGKYKILPCEFSYFNLSTKKYQTLRSDTLYINVLKSDGTEASSTFIASNDLNGDLNEDISPIFKEATLYNEKDILFDSYLYYTFLLLPAFLFLGFILFSKIKKRKTLNENEYLKVYAGKIANTQFTNAKELLNQGKDNEFNAELLRAMYQYISTKFEIETANLTKEHIKKIAVEKNISLSTIGKIESTLKSAEFASYAPATQEDNQTRFENATEIIHLIEKEFDNSKKKNTTIYTSILLFFIALSIHSISIASPNISIEQEAFKIANQYYDSGMYDNAVESYLNQIKNGAISHEVYFNLGNSYYRKNDILNSISFFEKSLKLNPNSIEARQNLKIAQSRLFDNKEKSNFEYVSFLSMIISKTHHQKINLWSYLSVLCTLIGFLFLFLNSKLHKFHFQISAITSFLFFGLFFILAYLHFNQIVNSEFGIVFQQNLPLQELPNETNASDLKIPEGKKVKILEKKSNYYFVSYEGNEGWVAKEGIKEI